MNLREYRFENLLHLSDYEAGGFLLGFYLAVQAEAVGIDYRDLTQEQREAILEKIRQQEARSAKHSGLEKALHKAASGEFETAGRLIKEILIEGAKDHRAHTALVAKRAINKKFNQAGRETAKQLAKKNSDTVLSAVNKILLNRQRKPSMRELARLVAADTGMNIHTVRGILSPRRK